MAIEKRTVDPFSNVYPSKMHAKSNVPAFVPTWMLKPERIFDPVRALHGAVRMGDTELAEHLIEYYGLCVDKQATLRQADLNGRLIRTVENYGWNAEHSPGGPSADNTSSLLQSGAHANAAVWNWPQGRWFSMASSAIVVADSSCYTPAEREAAFNVAAVLFKHGAALAFCDPGGDSFTVEQAHRVAVGLPRYDRI